MKERFWMDCNTVIDTAYRAEKDEEDSSLSILDQIRIRFHLLFCHDCSYELRNLLNLEKLMKTGFFPPSPDFGDLIMQRLPEEETAAREKVDAPAGFSFRGWVVIGFFMLFSLSSAFFGMNFVEIANAEGLSFLLPVGLTIGLVVTCYGAFFIGSHLKELSSRFGLR